MVKPLLMLCLPLTLLAGCQTGAFTGCGSEACCPCDGGNRPWWSCGQQRGCRQPWGVDEAYHGYKPTCWRQWQAPGAVWRNDFCGGSGACQPPTGQPTGPMVLPAPAVEQPLELAPPSGAPSASQERSPGEANTPASGPLDFAPPGGGPAPGASTSAPGPAAPPPPTGFLPPGDPGFNPTPAPSADLLDSAPLAVPRQQLWAIPAAEPGRNARRSLGFDVVR